MKDIKTIHSNITSTFTGLSGLVIEPNTVIDDYIYAASDGIHQAHIEIENAKNPYLYSKISGENLDDLGLMVNCAREPNESDDSYLHRLINWMTSNETSNEPCIEDALINLDYASYAQFYPYTFGVGTGSIYIIPNDYSEASQQNAINEVMSKVEPIKSAGSYIEYIIAPQKHVSIAAHIELDDTSDSNLIMNTIQEKIITYVNSIPVGNYLELGEINKIGMNENGVNYFVILQMYIDENPVNETRYLQSVFYKYTFDRLIY